MGERNCRLLTSSRRYYNIIVWISSPFFVFFIKFTIFGPSSCQLAISYLNAVLN